MRDDGRVERRTDAAVLWLRAFLLASVAFFIGIAGHVSADGLLPSTGLVAALFMLSVLACVPLVRRRLGLVRIVMLLVGGQAGVHLALTLSGGRRPGVGIFRCRLPAGS